MFTPNPVASDFDFIIIGSGLAGLQLALRLMEEKEFKFNKIALINPGQKTENDRTWCFWEKGQSRWDSIIHAEWKRSEIYARREKIELQLQPYSYKMIRGIDFYRYCFDRIQSAHNIDFITDEVREVKDQEKLLVKGEKGHYAAHKIFDSRIPQDFFTDQHFTKIRQHFKGYRIKTDEPVFDDQKFRFMDYRLKYNDSTSFTYILPFSPTEALVEFTFFTPFTVDDDVYDDYLKKYISTYLQIEDFRLEEIEQGQIPMSDFPFWNYSSDKLIKIGTAGGWVKASSGYAFKNTEHKVEQLVRNLKAKKENPAPVSKKRFRWYDSVFLKVLSDNNAIGEWLFYRFYKTHKPQKLFRFLDEESTLLEEFQIITSLFSKAFITAAQKVVKRDLN